MKLRGHKLNPFLWSKHTVKLVPWVIILTTVAIYGAIGLNFVDAEELGKSRLQIPKIGLSTAVRDLEPKDNQLPTPNYIAGAYSKFSSKKLLIGHSSTVFTRLSELQIGDQFIFDDKIYQIEKRAILKKQDISMQKILAPESNEKVVLMTCFGKQIDEQDYEERLIFTATRFQEKI